MHAKTAKMKTDNYIVTSHDINIDSNYAEWISDIKNRYRSAQVKAAVKVNAEKLLFNWQLGRELVIKKAEERWGAGVVEQISIDLKKEFPKETGFSTSNLWYMKKWYLFYTENIEPEKLQRAIRELQSSNNQIIKKLEQVDKVITIEKLHQVGGEFPLPLLLFRGGITLR